MKETVVPKIKLWIAFLPLSFFVVYIMTCRRWRRYGGSMWSPFWSATNLLLLVCCFGTELAISPLILLLAQWAVNALPPLLGQIVIMCGYYCMMTPVSLVMREVECKRLNKYLAKHQ